MKHFITFLIICYISLLSFLTHHLELPFHYGMLLCSTFPLSMILLNWNVSRFTFQELKRNRLRLLSYSLSTGYFLLCLLSAFQIIPIFPPVLERISKIQCYGYLFCVYFGLVLTFVNIYFVVRDSSRRDRGLPI